MAVSRFRPLGAHKLEVTSPFDSSTSFLLVFNTHYLSSKHRSKVAPSFLVVYYGGMSISTARGRLILEVK
jgi:hypothetical protein